MRVASNSLELGRDCLGDIHYFDATIADDLGNPARPGWAVAQLRALSSRRGLACAGRRGGHVRPVCSAAPGAAGIDQPRSTGPGFDVLGVRLDFGIAAGYAHAIDER